LALKFDSYLTRVLSSFGFASSGSIDIMASSTSKLYKGGFSHNIGSIGGKGRAGEAYYSGI